MTARHKKPKPKTCAVDRAWLENLVDKDERGVRTVSGIPFDKLDTLLMLAHPDRLIKNIPPRT
jgi:hypothetical protein